MKLPPLADRETALKKLHGRIAEYERRFGFTSASLRERLATGEQEETWDVCLWLILLEQRDRA